MSFSFEFTAKTEDAVAIIKEEHAPDTVKDFLLTGLTAFEEGTLVHVKAIGHLFNKDYTRTSGELLVEQVLLRTPNVQRDAPPMPPRFGKTV